MLQIHKKTLKKKKLRKESVMNYMLYMLLLLALYSQPLCTQSRIERYAQKIKSFFCRHTTKKVDYKEFPAASLHSLSIENSIGPITIKTGWKKNYLCLKTIRRAKNQTHLDALKIVAQRIQPNHLTLTTQEPESSSHYVEYELIIPESLTINLSTREGAITINDIQGSISAHTQRGDIIINDACNNITAHAKKGKINVSYKELSPTSIVDLETVSGTIALVLPLHSHATIDGTTITGTISSEHYITLKPCTTQLNSIAWNKLKKELHGTIGLASASISFSSVSGNVKILEKKTT